MKKNRSKSQFKTNKLQQSNVTDDDFIDDSNETIETPISGFQKIDKTLDGLSLIIVESPGKIKKIRSYLGSNFIVMASVGHIMDLPSKELGINLTSLEPSYEIYPDKKKVVSNLKNTLKNNNITSVYIASDADREGEFIGYSLVTLLKLKEYKRIAFHEITKNAINKALQSPTKLDTNMINAQQCRRIMDRLIGFLISPILSKNIKGGSGAGRVQSVIVKLILAKQLERDEFWKNNNSTYFICNAIFELNVPSLCSTIFKLNTKMFIETYIPKIESILIKTNKDIMLGYFELIKEYIVKNKFKILDVKKRNTINYPLQPFITSTLQQAAFYRYKYSPDRTMKLAQQLYEKGYITYMRTDSPNISQDAIFKIKEYIVQTYGDNFSKIRQFKSKNQNAQEAHECIRPSNIDKLYNTIEDVDEFAIRLYKLIWERTIASQMIESITTFMDIKIGINIVDYDIVLNKYNINHILQLPVFIGSISKITSIGYKIIYQEDVDEDSKLDINNIDFNIDYKIMGDIDDHKIKLINMSSSEQLNTSNPLYNEPLIIKTLEKYSIGRPSTYAALLKKIIDYKYVEIRNVDGYNKTLTDIKYNNKTKIIDHKEKITIVGNEKQKLMVTEIGKNVALFLTKYFPVMMDYKFTADMETKLDLIADGKLDHKIFIKDFYDNLSLWLSKIRKI